MKTRDRRATPRATGRPAPAVQAAADMHGAAVGDLVRPEWSDALRERGSGSQERSTVPCVTGADTLLRQSATSGTRGGLGGGGLLSSRQRDRDIVMSTESRPRKPWCSSSDWTASAKRHARHDCPRLRGDPAGAFNTTVAQSISGRTLRGGSPDVSSASTWRRRVPRSNY